MPERHLHVVVVGGGLTGLAAARRLARQGRRVTLLEAGPRLGGQVHTIELPDGTGPGAHTVAVDVGAEAMHTMAPQGPALIAELGLSEQVVVARGGESYLWTPRGRRRLPAGVGPAGPTRLRPVLTSGVMTLPGMIRAGLEPVAARLRPAPQLGPGHDLAVGDFVAARFGRQVADRFVDPLLGGLHSGDVRRLSLRATTPTLVGAARQSRSLMPLRLRDLPRRAVGSLAARLPADRAQDVVRRLPAPLRPAPEVARPSMDFLSFPGGLRTVLERMLDGLDVRVRVDAPVAALERAASGYRVRCDDGEEIEADGVVLAVPAWAAADLLRPLIPQAADTLAATRTASTVSVVLGFRRDDVTGVATLAGNGLLIPSTTGTLLKAITNLSAKWPQYADAELFWVRLSAGRDGQDVVAGMSDEALVDHLRRDLRALTGLDAAPVVVHVQRWPRGLPQLTVGHPDRTREVRDALAAALPGVALAGAAYDGIGLAACLASGQRAADEVAAACVANDVRPGRPDVPLEPKPTTSTPA